MEEKLNVLKNEFFDEIKSYNLTLSDLKNIGISQNSLQAEVYLKGLVGEEIIVDEELKSEFDASKKKIEKIDLNELGKISEMTTYVENLQKSEFDEKLDILMSKIRSETDDD